MAGPVPAAIGAISTAAGNDTTSVAYPTGVAANHLLIAFVRGDAGNLQSLTTWSTPSGWTKIVDSAAARRGCAAYYKLAVGSESGSLTFSCVSSGGVAALVGQIARYTGNATTGTIVHASAVTAVGSGTTVSPSSITTTVANELAIALICYGNAGTCTAITGMSGGTWAESAAEATSGGMSLDFQSAAKAAAGAISGGSATLSSSTTSTWFVVTFAINPASGVANTLALASASVSVTASAATLKVGRKLAQAAATVSVSANALGTKTARRASLAASSVSVSPATLGLKRGYRQALAAASVSVNASTFGLVYQPGSGAYSLVLAPASVAVSATALTPKSGRKLPLAAASVSANPDALGTRTRRFFGLGAASVSVLAGDIQFGATFANYLALAPVAITVNTSSLGLNASHRLSLGAASVSINASDIAFVAHVASVYTLSLEAASLAVTANSLSLDFTPGPEVSLASMPDGGGGRSKKHLPYGWWKSPKYNAAIRAKKPLQKVERAIIENALGDPDATLLSKLLAPYRTPQGIDWNEIESEQATQALRQSLASYVYAQQAKQQEAEDEEAFLVLVN